MATRLPTRGRTGVSLRGVPRARERRSHIWLFAVVTGALDIIAGTRLLISGGAQLPEVAAADPVLNSQIKFLGAVWCGFGVALWWTTSRPAGAQVHVSRPARNRAARRNRAFALGDTIRSRTTVVDRFHRHRASRFARRTGMAPPSASLKRRRRNAESRIAGIVSSYASAARK